LTYPDNTFAVIGIPLEGGSKTYLAALSVPASNGSGLLNVDDLIPDHWVKRRWYLTECSVPQDMQGGVQNYPHLALCEWTDSPVQSAVPIMVNDIALNGTFLVMPHHADGPHYFHCTICAQNAINWIIDNQEAWHAQASRIGVKETTPSLN
jgi:hypothetical protein